MFKYANELRKTDRFLMMANLWIVLDVYQTNDENRTKIAFAKCDSAMTRQHMELSNDILLTLQ